ncbi:hypothetical protein [Chryseobacterium balustinum]|uniref:Uncharacterized protein n=2 Tax=Chryseobacterium balustinum TaxID=246 RepID=A0AAX2IR93_9FLAO|nr:hypothetical protein [Chryseobacterium balustinum]SKB89509.1 hypothetical protein SAMN05421800_11310 [Chryseobacterium balustinum]SQA92773.1 Uncharacterised protein [Chryseobacterium balustinum]
MYFKKVSIIYFILINIFIYSQFERKKIETDSSYIEIVKNSKYKVFNEIYKSKDSIWSRVTFIDDTLKLNSEGWTTKQHKRLGIWQEYNENGDLMYTRDYDNNTCIINSNLYPYHNLLVETKKKADKLILENYGEKFMNNHVIFEFYCYAYQDGKYVGSWDEPLSGKPNSFIFDYSVRLKKTDKPIYLRIEINKNGRLVPQEHYYNYAGFEKIEEKNRIFRISKENAIAIANTKGLKNNNNSKVQEYLIWENQKTNGYFRYYITNLVDKIHYEKSEDRKGIVYKFDVYVFNPWTGKFIEKKKMKSIEESGKRSDHTTGLLPDIE